MDELIHLCAAQLGPLALPCQAVHQLLQVIPVQNPIVIKVCRDRQGRFWQGHGDPRESQAPALCPSMHLTMPNQLFPQGLPKVTIPVGAPRALPALLNINSSPCSRFLTLQRSQNTAPVPSLTKDTEGIAGFDVRGGRIAEDTQHIKEVFKGHAAILGL